MTRISACWRDTVWTTRTVIVAYVAIGVGLTLQPSRFANTPSYANLIAFTPSEAWGCGYLAVAALLVAWRLSQRPTQWLGILAHTAAAILTMWWLAAFVIRYATDDGTTIVNVVSWSVFLSLVARSAQGIDDDERR